MLNKLGLYTHGEVRVQKIKINHGSTVYLKREKFCVEHDWIDIFLFPNWEEKHGNCGHVEPKNTGAYLELPEDNKPKMMATAA